MHLVFRIDYSTLCDFIAKIAKYRIGYGFALLGDYSAPTQKRLYP